MDQWRMVFKKGRDEFIKQVNDAYTRMEGFYSGLAQGDSFGNQEIPVKKPVKPVEKQTASVRKETGSEKRPTKQA